jgi:uncharacterized protein YbaR (Trm112 family)
VNIKSWAEALPSCAELRRELISQDTSAISAELAALLRCPQNGQTLAPASAALVAQLDAARLRGALRNQAGAPVESPIQAGLLRADGAVFYLIREGLPVLLAGEAIPAPF